jgi:hypothetical protein
LAYEHLLFGLGFRTSHSPSNLLAFVARLRDLDILGSY